MGALHAEEKGNGGGGRCGGRGRWGVVLGSVQQIPTL